MESRSVRRFFGNLLFRDFWALIELILYFLRLIDVIGTTGVVLIWWSCDKRCWLLGFDFRLAFFWSWRLNSNLFWRFLSLWFILWWHFFLLSVRIADYVVAPIIRSWDKGVSLHRYCIAHRNLASVSHLQRIWSGHLGDYVAVVSSNDCAPRDAQKVLLGGPKGRYRWWIDHEWDSIDWHEGQRAVGHAPKGVVNRLHWC